jgi:hypothetical protein
MSTYVVCDESSDRRHSPIYISGIDLEIVDRLDKYGEETLTPVKRAYMRRYFERGDATELSMIKKISFPNFVHEVLNFEIRREISHEAITPSMRKGNSEEIFRWFSELPEDEEYANILDETVEKMRAELKLI